MSETTEPTLDAQVITGLLSERHPAPEWAFLAELRNQTGYSRQDRYFDAWAVNCYPSKGFHRVAYEIKVSRADFARELADPSKRSQAMKASNEFFFVAPAGIIRADEVPESCGLIEVMKGKAGWKLRRKKHAQQRDIGAEMNLGFVCSILRRCQNTQLSGLRVFHLAGRAVSAEELFGVVCDVPNWYNEREDGELKRAAVEWSTLETEKQKVRASEKLQSFLDILAKRTGSHPLNARRFREWELEGQLNKIQNPDKDEKTVAATQIRYGLQNLDRAKIMLEQLAAKLEGEEATEVES